MDMSDNYQRHIEPIEDQMIGVIWRLLRDPDDADDAMQDALARIWSKRKKVFKHPNPKALILRICINSAYDKLRQRAKQHRDQQNLRAQAKEGVEASSDSAIQNQELRSQVLRQIALLPRQQGVAVLMRLVEQQPYLEIAQLLGCSEATVRVHVTRGRSNLQERLKHLNPNNDR